MEDPFLAALAESGHQVGELAKHYFPGGHDITTLDYEEAESQSKQLLDEKNVILYEPAIRFENLFIRIDILVKKGNHVQMIEVKAKSFDPEDPFTFVGKRGGIKSGWRPYMEDVAFQDYVLRNAYPHFEVSSYLMLTDKTALCPTNGLHTKFLIRRGENNRKGVSVSTSLSDEDLAEPILRTTNVDGLVSEIQRGTVGGGNDSMDFEKQIAFLSDAYKADTRIESKIGIKCGSCEFNCRPEDEAAGLLNGYKECFSKQLGWTDKDFEDSTVFELNAYRSKEAILNSGRCKLKEMSEDDLNLKPSKDGGLTQTERQLLQIEKVKLSDFTPYINREGLRAEMESLVYPLHFIDFETTTLAIPFSVGRRPYETVAFQYSHHIMQKDGTIEHVGEYLNETQSFEANYEFVRALKKELENDRGSIFRYSNHENTVLNAIKEQLKDDADKITDRDELIEFIMTITRLIENKKEVWRGPRCMVDLWNWVKLYYYDPSTHGSNSLKYVLPAILNSSIYLQEKYSQPIYGSKDGIPSRNYSDWTWIVQEADGSVRDPYKLLPKLFADASDKDYDLLSEGDELGNGGAALSAYGRMQFTEMSNYERQELRKGLLKYCELDTMAMIMLFEGWKYMLQK